MFSITLVLEFQKLIKSYKKFITIQITLSWLMRIVSISILIRTFSISHLRFSIYLSQLKSIFSACLTLVTFFVDEHSHQTSLFTYLFPFCGRDDSPNWSIFEERLILIKKLGDHDAEHTVCRMLYFPWVPLLYLHTGPLLYFMIPSGYHPWTGHFQTRSEPSWIIQRSLFMCFMLFMCRYLTRRNISLSSFLHKQVVFPSSFYGLQRTPGEWNGARLGEPTWRIKENCITSEPTGITRNFIPGGNPQSAASGDTHAFLSS